MCVCISYDFKHDGCLQPSGNGSGMTMSPNEPELYRNFMPLQLHCETVSKSQGKKCGPVIQCLASKRNPSLNNSIPGTILPIPCATDETNKKGSLTSTISIFLFLPFSLNVACVLSCSMLLSSWSMPHFMEVLVGVLGRH